MRHHLKFIAITLVAVAVIAFILHAFLAPRVLRVAVGPTGNPELRVIVAFLQALQRERAPVRLKLILTDGITASGKALEDGKADLAIVRSDIGLPPQSATVAIMRRESVYFITRPGSKIDSIDDLRGKTIGLVGDRPANEAILRTILNQHDVSDKDVLRMSVVSNELIQAVQEGRIDAVFMVAPTAARMARMALQNFPKIEGKSPGLLVISEAEALVEQNPAYDTVEIVRGAFGASPALPDSAITTLAVTHRLVARRALDESVVSELTRLLFALRLQIAAEAPSANQLELPSTEDRGAKLPVHPGTIAYVEGETKTFFERYSDLFWFGIMGLSLFGSAITAFYSRFVRQKPNMEPDTLLKSLLRLMQAARLAPDMDTLSRLEAESEEVIASLILAMADEDETARIASLGVLMAESRRVIVERRRQLASLRQNTEARVAQ